MTWRELCEHMAPALAVLVGVAAFNAGLGIAGALCAGVAAASLLLYTAR